MSTDSINETLRLNDVVEIVRKSIRGLSANEAWAMLSKVVDDIEEAKTRIENGTASAQDILAPIVGEASWCAHVATGASAGPWEIREDKDDDTKQRTYGVRVGDGDNSDDRELWFRRSWDWQRDSNDVRFIEVARDAVPSLAIAVKALADAIAEFPDREIAARVAACAASKLKQLKGK